MGSKERVRAVETHLQTSLRRVRLLSLARRISASLATRLSTSLACVYIRMAASTSVLRQAAPLPPAIATLHTRNDAESADVRQSEVWKRFEVGSVVVDEARGSELLFRLARRRSRVAGFGGLSRVGKISARDDHDIDRRS